MKCKFSSLLPAACTVLAFLCSPFAVLVEAQESEEDELDSLLSMDIEDLMEIEVVSASKKKQQVQEVPATVRVITAQQIRERGYFTLEEALSDLPGMQFRNLLGLNSYVFMRGVPSQNNLVLVLMDGIPLNELNSGGFYGGGHYNLANVKRIEVVYGPASALYGTNAVSGIINIITFDPTEKEGLEVSGLYGTFDTWSADLGFSYNNPAREFGVRASLMAKTSEKADLRGAAGDNNWSNEMENFEDDYALDAKVWLKNVTLGVNYQNRRSSTATYFPSVGTQYLDVDTYWNVVFFNGYLKHQAKLGENLTLDSQVYYRNATIRDDSVQKVTETGQIGYHRPNHLMGLEGMLTWIPLERLSLIGGIVVEHDWLAEGYANTESISPEERPPRPGNPEMSENTMLSAYVEGGWVAAAPLRVTLGARFDSSSAYGQVLTPRGGLVLNVRDLTAKLIYTEAFRAPRPWDFTDGLGNSSLDPERMRAAELYLGYDVTEKIRLSVATHANLLDGVLTKEYLEDDWRWINKGRIYTVGVETEVAVTLGRLDTYGNYTYTYSADEDGEAVPEIAAHGGNFGLRYPFNEWIVANLRFNFLGSRRNPSTVTATGSEYLDPAVLLHAAVSLLDLKGFDLQLFVGNALNTEYYHTSNREVERYRQPGRSVMVRVRYIF